MSFHLKSAASQSQVVLLRAEGTNEDQDVTYVELFFDLVFVLAFAMLSKHAVANLTILGALQILIFSGAVWWTWINTTWVTNWLNPRHPVAWTMLMLLMVGTVLLAVKLPAAFGIDALPFALTYVVMQVGRSLFVVFAYRQASARLRANALRITVWFLLSAPLWLAGATFLKPHQILLWSLALLIEFAGPLLRYRLPFLGRSNFADWHVDGRLMGKRTAEFIIIALGEVVLAMGLAMAEGPLIGLDYVVFASSVLALIALWWLYFEKDEESGVNFVENAEQPSRIARNDYTYFLMPIMLGIIVIAIVIEAVLADPLQAIEQPILIAAIMGPLIYLSGTILFKWQNSAWQRFPLSHGVGAVVLALAMFGLFTAQLPMFWIAIVLAAVLICISVIEERVKAAEMVES